MKYLILAFIAIAFTVSCKEAAKDEETPKDSNANMAKAEWLLGNWENNTSEGNFSENWKKVNDSVFHGDSYFAKDGDTVFAETVVLDQISGNMAYTVTVPSQNDEKPVRFEMTSVNENQVTFENPAHDFPNKISYRKITNDSIVAEISGNMGNKQESQKFPMKRKQ